MSDSPEKHGAADEDVQMTLIPGSGEPQSDSSPASCSQVIINMSCCRDQYHRKLAIASIICGISCIGIKALIDSVKAEQTADQEKAHQYLQRAKKLSIISMVVLLVCLVALPLLVALVSYLLTLSD